MTPQETVALATERGMCAHPAITDGGEVYRYVNGLTQCIGIHSRGRRGGEPQLRIEWGWPARRDLMECPWVIVSLPPQLREEGMKLADL
jgi:hypothetical protein